MNNLKIRNLLCLVNNTHVSTESRIARYSSNYNCQSPNSLIEILTHTKLLCFVDTTHNFMCDNYYYCQIGGQIY